MEFSREVVGERWPVEFLLGSFTVVRIFQTNIYIQLYMYNQYKSVARGPYRYSTVSDVPEISTSCVYADLDYYAKNVLFEGSVGTPGAILNMTFR